MEFSQGPDDVFLAFGDSGGAEASTSVRVIPRFFVTLYLVRLHLYRPNAGACYLCYCRILVQQGTYEPRLLCFVLPYIAVLGFAFESVRSSTRIDRKEREG